MQLVAVASPVVYPLRSIPEQWRPLYVRAEPGGRPRHLRRVLSGSCPTWRCAFRPVVSHRRARYSAAAVQAPRAELRGRGLMDAAVSSRTSPSGTRGRRAVPVPARRPRRLVRRRPSPRRSVTALDDLTLEIERGRVFAIIGHNGAGKTTALKLATRIAYPTAGRIRVRGRVGALIEVGTGMHPELTGRENIMLYGRILGMSRADIRRRFDADRRVRGNRRGAGAAGQAVLVGDAAPARLLARRAPRARRLRRRRGDRGRRRRLPVPSASSGWASSCARGGRWCSSPTT